MSAGELVDVVDENDCVIDRVARSEMRRCRLRHRCVYILLFDSAGCLFVHRRTPTKDVYPGFWDVAIGGVVATGETYDGGASREVVEEVGLVRVTLTRLFPMMYEDDLTRVRGMVYECVSDQPLRLQAEEIAEGRWISPHGVTELAGSERFCPDGLAVLHQYMQRRPA